MDIIKALFHINENTRWKMVIANIDNLIKDAGKENVIIEVVANGKAVSIFNLPDNELQTELKDIERLAEAGVKIMVCRNSLKGLEISEKQIPEYATVVPAGITQIIIRQQQGYAYVKP